ncbi:MAG: metalloprotease TldD [Pseudomonadota bacterium]|nr:metalloprotease TldD [Pseudomonadota bacterium]
MSQSSLEIASQRLLQPNDLGARQLERVLGLLVSRGVDSADLYFQLNRHEAWVLEDGIVKDASYDVSQGVGVRAISGEKIGFAYSDEIDLSALEQASKAARAIVHQGQTGSVCARATSRSLELYGPVDPLTSMDSQSKVALLQDIDRFARSLDSRVKQVIVSLSGVHDTVLVVASDGTFSGDVRPLVRLNVSVIVESNGRRERGSAGGGGRSGYDQLLARGAGEAFAREAVRQALVSLEADEAPAGQMTVVLGSGWPGVLLHEAIGHGLEGDFNRKGTSAFSGRLGERVASPLCSIVDDGTLPGRRGSLNVDDEGVPTQSTMLIEDGILRTYMQDKHNAALMGMEPTGNGRRESFAHLPLPRMTNTYMLAGPHDPQEIIESVSHGLYAANFGGGQVDITSGKFVFSANEAYLIENGKIGRPVKGATLIGHGPDVLTRVSMVGNDLALDEGVGTCGKDGQSVPVGVGQPTLRVDGLTVGGTQKT